MNRWKPAVLYGLSLLLLTAMSMLAGCGVAEDDSAPVLVRGEARLPDGSRFPDQGTLEIALVNTLLADTPSAVVARHAVEDPAGGKTYFEFPVEGDLIEDGMVYALSATYRDGDDRVWFVTDSQATIEPRSKTINGLAMIAVAPESGAEAAPAPAPVEGPVEAHYLCGDTPVRTIYESGQVTLHFQGEDKPLVLPTAMSASGARFAQDGNEFWSKGQEATLIRAGQPAITCQEHTPPTPQAEPPATAPATDGQPSD